MKKKINKNNFEKKNTKKLKKEEEDNFGKKTNGKKWEKNMWGKLKLNSQSVQY